MAPRASRRLRLTADHDTIVVQPGQQGSATTVPQVALESDEEEEDPIPTTYTSTFMIPQSSGAAIPSFTMQQPASQVRVEPTFSQPATGGLHALSAEAIDEMFNSAVMRALHQATSAQTLTTPQTDPLPRQLRSTIPPASTFPTRPMGFTTIAGLQGHQYSAHAAIQLQGTGYGWEPSDGGQFSFPGILLPPITDPKIISRQELLPEVDTRVMKKVLDDTFAPTDVLLLVPLESRNKANALLCDEFLDLANIARDPREFSMVHQAPALYNYAAIVIYFAPDATKGPLATAFATYIGCLMSWAERYSFRAILQYHVHLHAGIICLQGVYRAEAWSAEAPHLMASYITPNVDPITYEPRKRHREDSGTSQLGGTGGVGTSQKGRGDGRCWNWNAGRVCAKEPCTFMHTCSVDGRAKAHKAVDHRPEKK